MNFFKLIEGEVFENEEIMFDENKIQEVIIQKIMKEIEKKSLEKRGFYFEKIICDFFNYLNFSLIKTKKTRDFGLDGIVNIEIDPFGKLNLGLQIKYKKIDSTDIDKFIQALNYAELKLGVIACKDSRRLKKYELTSKLKAFFFSRNIKTNLKSDKSDKIDINPVFILKLKDIINLAASNMRAIAKAFYKK